MMLVTRCCNNERELANESSKSDQKIIQFCVFFPKHSRDVVARSENLADDYKFLVRLDMCNN